MHRPARASSKPGPAGTADTPEVNTVDPNVLRRRATPRRLLSRPRLLSLSVRVGGESDRSALIMSRVWTRPVSLHEPCAGDSSLRGVRTVTLSYSPGGELFDPVPSPEPASPRPSLSSRRPAAAHKDRGAPDRGAPDPGAPRLRGHAPCPVSCNPAGRLRVLPCNAPVHASHGAQGELRVPRGATSHPERRARSHSLAASGPAQHRLQPLPALPLASLPRTPRFGLQMSPKFIKRGGRICASCDPVALGCFPRREGDTVLSILKQESKA